MWTGTAINLSVVLAGVLTVIYFYIKRQFSFWERKRVPFLKPHFFYGSFADFVTRKASVAEVTVKLYNGLKGRRFGGVWEMHTPKLFVVDLDLVRQILVKDFATWPDRDVALNLDVDPLAQHLVSLAGKKWKLVRAKLTPTFTSAKLKQMHYLLLECAENFEKYLHAVAKCGEPVEVREITAKFTTDVIGSCAFGIEMNSLNDKDALFRRIGRQIFEITFWKRMAEMIQGGFPWLFRLLKLSTISKEITEFFLNIIRETFDYREKNNIQRHDFIDLLRNLKSSGEVVGEDEVEFDDKLLAAQAFVFFAGGFETSSTTISYCFHELAVNKDIQHRLREEVHRTKAANDGEISWDGLNNMKYLDMVVKETLRKYPIAPHLNRITVEPYRIPDTDVELPAGLKCIIPVYALHHDPEYYPEPEKFDPERFTEEAKSQRPAFAYLPFGGGPRVCIGLRFAEQQVKMGIVKTVDNFEISLCEKSQNPLRHNTVSRLLYPEVGIWLKISRNIPDKNSPTKERP